MELSTADRLAISELIARYNVAIDSGDREGWLKTFTSSGVFDGIHGRFEGTEELRGFIDAYWSEESFARLRGTQHWISGLIIEGQDDEATCYCYGTVLTQGVSDNRILGTWHYRDVVHRVSGEWRFAERFVRAFSPQTESTQ